ncbi:hypothetical protein H8M03_02020 [Sphingomonas sabuli]|uniref:Uncharacterized protein n=1 Tax=Sphingomonas sabuli TaxID=2764186 RepID=A0A7G9L3G0_9SPHN|nr:hypothetical protein [Sphingomonas sabuli]QNM83159.1 hypothetical protein H8M03_02020 [Sphingomonas sabuli]
MTTDSKPAKDKKDKAPPATFSENPNESLETALRKDPDDQSKKVDVGSDESMDASDPVSASLPEHREPAPSSSFEERKGESKS